MKKFIVLTLTTILCVALLTGCMATTTASIFGGSYFLRDYETMGVSNLDETTTYKLSFTKGDNTSVDFTLENGTYTTHAYTSEYNGVKCYRLDTALSVKGSYAIGGETTPVDDSILTTAYFLGVENALKPLFSERTVKAHSVTTDGNQYSAEYYDYKLTTVYDDKTATVTFTPDDPAKYSLQAGETVYKDVFKNTYFDNETLLFAVRSFKLSTSFSASFDSIDTISKTKRTLSLTAPASSNSASTTKETLTVDLTSGGEKINSVEAYKLNLMISGTFTGSTIELYYSDPEANAKKLGQQLIKMKVSLPSSVGAYTYGISSITSY